jgi:hypothetical protein
LTLKHIFIRVKSKLKSKAAKAKVLLGLGLVQPLASSSSGISASTIFNGLWSIVLSLFDSLAQDIGVLFGDIFSGLGGSIVDMFNTFGMSFGPYGIWAPIAFVVSLGGAMVIGFVILDVVDAEKDVTGFENDV